MEVFKMDRNNTWVGLTLSAALLCGVTEVRAWQQGNGRRVDCSQPKPQRSLAPESSSEQPEPEGTFVPGPANGSVRSGSTTLAVNPGLIRFPAMTLALPSFQLPSLSRVRREAAMLVDEQEAPFVRGEVADVNAALSQRPRQESAAEREDSPKPESDNETPIEENMHHHNCPQCYPPCVPSAPCEGCASRNNGPDAEQVARLEARMAMLQKAVSQLVEVQAGGTAVQQSGSAGPAAAAKSTVRPVGRSQQREADAGSEIPGDERPSTRPVRQISAQAAGADHETVEARLLRQQAAQIEELQRQLDELKQAQSANRPVSSSGQQKPQQNSAAGRAKLTTTDAAKKSSNPFSGLLGGLGVKRR
jgi:hypothetical protein